MVGLLLHPPKSDDNYAQLTRGAFIINDSLQNPHFSFHAKFVENASVLLTWFDFLQSIVLPNMYAKLDH